LRLKAVLNGNLVRTGYQGGRRCRTGSANGGVVWWRAL